MERVEGHAAIRPLCEALDRDRSDRLAALDETTVLRMPGQSGLAGVYQGREAILDLVDRLMQLTDGTLRLTLTSHRIDPQSGVALLVHATAARRERYLATDVELTVLVHGDRVNEIRVATSNQPRFDQFWS